MEQKSWNLFLDDERKPRDVKWAPSEVYNKYITDEWEICTTKFSMIQVIFQHEKIAPSFISFDHDLGEYESTGYDAARWLVEMDMNEVIKIPDNFTFYVHSKNPVGKENIEKYLNNYLRLKNANDD